MCSIRAQLIEVFRESPPSSLPAAQERDAPAAPREALDSMNDKKKRNV